MNDISLLNGRTLLFVDDEESYSELFREVLAKESCHILEALGAESAIELLEKYHQQISVVIIDYNMPGQNGMDLLQLILRRWPHISRIMSTAGSELTIAKAAINKGQVVAYCNKPWNVAELVESIKNAVLIHDEYMYNNQIKRLYSELENHDQFREELISLSGSHILDLTSTMSSFYQVIDELEGEEYQNFLAAANIANNMIASHVRNVSDYLSIRDHTFAVQMTQISKRHLARSLGDYYRGVHSIELLFDQDVPDLLLLDDQRIVRMLANMINYVMVETFDRITVHISMMNQGQAIKFDVVNMTDFTQHLRCASHLLESKKEADLDTNYLVGSAFGLLVTKLMAEAMTGSAGISNTNVSHIWFTLSL